MYSCSQFERNIIEFNSSLSMRNYAKKIKKKIYISDIYVLD